MESLPIDSERELGPDQKPRELAVLDEVSQILAKATSLEDVKAVRDRAEAARTYARAAQLGLDLQNRAAEIKLRAERKAGAFLASLKLRGGDRRSMSQGGTLQLKDLGISRQQSKRWQSVASVSEEAFSKYLRSSNQLGHEVTSAGLLRAPRRGGAGGQVGKATREAPFTRNELPVSAASTKELVEELQNHCQLLTDVLRPLYQGEDWTLKQVERRTIFRLLTEMNALIRQLK